MAKMTFKAGTLESVLYILLGMGIGFIVTGILICSGILQTPVGNVSEDNTSKIVDGMGNVYDSDWDTYYSINYSTYNITDIEGFVMNASITHNYTPSNLTVWYGESEIICYLVEDHIFDCEFTNRTMYEEEMYWSNLTEGE